MRQFLCFFSFLIFFLTLVKSDAQVRITEISSDGVVELMNTGNDVVDLSNYWLCDRPAYDRIGTLTLECGSLMLQPDEIIGIRGASVDVDPAGGEMGIYSSSSFGSSDALVDYVIWGDRSGSTRESVAVAAGLWTDEDRVAAFESGESLNQTGDTNNAAAWTVEASSTCESAMGCEAMAAVLTGGPYTFCVGDGVADNIPDGEINVEGGTGSNTQWVVTDGNLNILGLPDDIGMVNFDDAGAGMCLIWLVHFDGELTGVSMGANAGDIEGCFELSNSITVNRNQPDGGTLEGGPFTFCVDGEADNIPEDAITRSGASGENEAWIITDEQGVILGLPASFAAVNFDDAGTGTCFVWNIRYDGDLQGLQAGSNTDDLEGCFDLSNGIQVNRVEGDECTSDCEAQGGTLDGGPFTFCVDGQEDFIPEDGITLTDNSGTNSQWVITDMDGVILGLPMDGFSVVNFDGAGVGTCLVWHLSFEDGLIGAEMGANANDLEGCFSLSNPITVYRQSPDGGMVELADGGTTFAYCAGDIVFDVQHTTAAPNLSYWYIITDDNDNILAWVNSAESNTLDLSGAPAGTCRVWGWSYRGLGDPIVGDPITSLTDDDCEAISDNFITVYREVPDGGMVQLVGGGTEYTGTAGDIMVAVEHTTTAPNLSYWYIITDDNDNILAFANSANTNMLDLSGAPAGTCRIWGWNYRGLGDPIPGESITTLSDDFCEDVSDGFITVLRLEGDVCEAQGGTLDGGPFTFCVDGQEDFIPEDGITLTDNSGTNSQWVITDMDGVILGLPMDGFSVVNFDGAGVGTCLVWHLSFEDGLIGAEMGANANDLEGCFSLSNPITVYRQSPDGGMVELADGGTTFAYCAGDIVFDVQHTTAAPNLSYWYIITDDNDNILAWVNSAESNTLDLSGAPAGTCRVWGWSYRGLGDPIVGDPISSLTDDDCEAISDNFITVYREVPDGGMVQLVGGGTEYTGTAGDIMVAVEHTTTAPNLSYWYIITDDNDNILAFANSANTNMLDLSGAPAGTCRIWGWNYRGLGDPIPGESITTLSDDFCEDVSDGFITVLRQEGDVCEAQGGTLDGGPFTFCVDGQEDFIPEDGITLTDNSGTNSQWVITDMDGVILGLPMDGFSVVNFDGAGVGTCLVWHLSFEDGLIGAEMGANANDLEGCFSLSNPITVYRQSPDGGMVELADGGTTFAYCAGDIVFDVQHTTAAPNLSYWYIITDDNDNILAWVNSAESNTLDLSGAPAGTCRVWGWSYRGLGDPIVGDPITSLTDDDCEAISDNFITVYREVPDGGMVQLVGGGTEYTGTAGDIMVAVEHTTTAPNLSYWYIITDDNDNILAFANSANTNMLDLSGAPAGTCRIWGWNYRGLGDPIPGESITTLSDDFCEDISDDFITVIRQEGDVCEAQGGTLDGGPFTFCVDGQEDFIPEDGITLTDNSGTNSQWVITDMDGVILGLPMDGFSVVNFDGAGVGTCLVWHLSFEDGLIGAEMGANANDLEGCFSLSNPITVYRQSPDGGMVELADGGTTFAYCAGDIVFDVQHTTAAPNLSYWYIITDDNDNILAWVNSAESNTLDLSGAPAGTCRVWGWSYRGLGDPIVGDPISSLTDDDCEAISDNFITVYREVPDGGMVQLVGGGTEYTGTAGDIMVAVEHTTTAPNLSYWYIITDDNDNILAFANSANTNMLDLSGAPAGTCRIWGWNYRGLGDPIPGESITTLSDDFCEDISDDFITVIRQEGDDCNVDGGVIESASGVTELTFCVGDGRPNPMDVRLDLNTGTNSVWVVTDYEGYILALQEGNRFDFEEAGVGICLIWHLSYEDGLTGAELGANAADLNGCFSLSNPITVNRVDCNDVCHTPFNVRVRQSGRNRVSLRWDRVASAIGYDVEIGYSESDKVIVFPTTSRKLKITLRSGRGDLEVRVRARCGAGEVSDFSDTVNYELDARGDLLSKNRSNDISNDNEIVISDAKLTLYPNPASDQLQIQLDFVPENSRMAVIDGNGRTIMNENMNQASTQIDVSNLQSGIYLVLIQSNDKVLSSERFIKI